MSSSLLCPEENLVLLLADSSQQFVQTGPPFGNFLLKLDELDSLLADLHLKLFQPLNYGTRRPLAFLLVSAGPIQDVSGDPDLFCHQEGMTWSRSPIGEPIQWFQSLWIEFNPHIDHTWRHIPIFFERLKMGRHRHSSPSLP